ncbi:MAG TPA: aminoglycoside phosphotransferase family protein [Trebonia sp.]
MSAFTIPALLAQTARRQPEVASWISDLPGIVTGLAERWSLQVGEPFQPGGFCSWTAPAARGSKADGGELVLKIGFPFASGEQRDEAAALRIWDGDGAVRLCEAVEMPTATALLLERCVPGSRLQDVVPEPARDVVVADMLRQLWARASAARSDGQTNDILTDRAGTNGAPAGGDWPFRPLTEMCDAWADQFWQDYAAADPASRLDPGLARDGIALFRELPRTADRTVLLCTDLHSENILAARRAPWLAIDPKPYMGDPAYDLLQYIINCDDRVAADPAGLSDRMAGLAGVDPGRARLWLFARAVQESVGSALLREAAGRLAPP